MCTEHFKNCSLEDDLMSENEEKKDYMIKYDRPNCIGAGVCAAVAPDHWEMDADGKANLLDSKKLDNEIFEKQINEDQLDVNKQAAEGCPVQVIKMFNNKTNEEVK